MPRKPTCEKLEQRVKELEKEAPNRKETEEALSSTHRKLRAVFDAIQDNINVVDLDFNLTAVNEVIVKAFGLSDKERVLNRKCFNVLKGRKEICPNCAVAEAYRTKARACRTSTPEDEVSTGGRNFEVFAYPIMDGDGNLTGAVEFARDVTERKQAEKELRESEEKLAGIIASVTDHMSIIDDKHNIVWANDIAKELFGPDLLGKKCYSSYHGYDKPCEPCVARKCFEDGKVHEYETVVTTRDGKQMIFWSVVSATAWHSDGRPKMVAEISRNITDRKQAEQALRESEEKFRSIFSQSPIGIELYDSKGQLLDANRFCIDIFGISDFAEVKGFKIFDDPNVPEDAKRKLREGETVRYEVSFDFERVKRLNLYRTTKSGTIELDVLITQLGLKEKESFQGYLVQVQDISHRKLAEQRIHTMSQQLIKAQETERQALARDLHDYLAQDLSTAKFGLDTLLDDQAKIPFETRQKVSDLSKTLRGIIKTIRDMAYSLSPASLNELGLVQTLVQYCEEFSARSSVKIDFFHTGIDKLVMGFDSQINLYRLVQEGLNNIKKHADASYAIIRLLAVFPNIILRIEDDGKGFDVKDRLLTAMADKRMGLRSMQERVSLLRGTMTIQSRPMDGTRIFITVPHKEKKSGKKGNHIDR
jgi:PAS domain S-box-containing protein